MKHGMFVGMLLGLAAIAAPASAVVTELYTADPSGSAAPGEINSWSAGTPTQLLSGLYTISGAGDITLAGNQAAIFMIGNASSGITSVSFHGLLTGIKVFVATSDGAVYTSDETNPSGWYGFTSSGLDLFGQPIYIESLAFAGISRRSVGDINMITWNGTKAAVPEPASWALMFMGFGLMGAAIRRRERSFAS